MTVAAALGAAIALWLSASALAVAGPGPLTPRVGLLAPWWLLGLLLIWAAAAAWRWKKPPLPILAGLLTILPWLPGAVPAAGLVWIGPLAWLVWAGVVASVVASWRRRQLDRWPVLADPQRAPVVATLGAAAFLATLAWGASPSVPGGDEPHYLIITQSLLYDRDLKIENNHARRDYAPYVQGTLKPDYFMRGKDAQIYSVHAPGLPALIAPAFAIGGYAGVVFFLVLIAALGAGLLWRVAFAATGHAGAAWFGTLATIGAVPIAFHSFTIYPDLPAGILALTGVWALVKLDRTPKAVRHLSQTETETGGAPLQGCGPARAWFLHGLALAILPWLHSRFAILSGLLGLCILLRLPRTRRGLRLAAAFLAAPAVSAVLWFWFFYAIYGTPNPDAPYGSFARTQAAWSFVPDGLLGALLDQQFGLLPYAPVYALVFGGWVATIAGPERPAPPHAGEEWRGPLRPASRRLAVELAIVAAPYMVAVTYLRMWWGGWSAPARFSVPVLFIGGIFAAIAWRRFTSRGARATAVAALLVTLVTTTMLAFVEGGRLAYNVRNGRALWLEWLTPLAYLPAGLPSFFAVPDDFPRQTLVWTAPLAAAAWALRWLAVRGLRTREALALATMLVYAGAAMIALTLTWRGWRPAAAVLPAPAQLELLRDLRSTGGRAGLRYDPPALLSAGALPAAMEIESPSWLRDPRDRQIFVLPGWIPAGRYQLVARERSETITVGILRTEPPIQSYDTDHLRRGAIVELPVAVPTLVVRADTSGSDEIRLKPLAISRDDHLAGRRALRARRYGHWVVYFLDGDAFAEQDAFWVGGGADTEVVVQPDAAATATAGLFVRNGPVENRLLVEAGTWRDERRLAPGEERELAVPLDTRRGATKLRFWSESGFTPSAVDPKSADDRFLGIWIQIRR